MGGFSWLADLLVFPTRQSWAAQKGPLSGQNWVTIYFTTPRFLSNALAFLPILGEKELRSRVLSTPRIGNLRQNMPIDVIADILPLSRRRKNSLPLAYAL